MSSSGLAHTVSTGRAAPGRPGMPYTHETRKAKLYWVNQSG
jgi:hypothetical protein